MSIVQPSSPVMAGDSLTLTCSQTVLEGISGSPTLTWTRGGVQQSTGSSLTFSSLLTSHGGVYTCTARLTIPEAGVDVSGLNTTNVSVQSMLASYNVANRSINFFLHIVPPPLMTISGSPRNTSFFQGLNLVFTCDIILDEAVDTSVTVQGTWNRNESELVDELNEGRITISNPLLTMPPYRITVRFSPLNVSDAGTYECNATVTPQDTTFVTGTTSSISRTINVTGRSLASVHKKIIPFFNFLSSLQVSPLRQLIPSLMKACQQLGSLATH